MMMPMKRPGYEKPRLYSTIMPTSICFLNPSALSIPYSYVLESTSESIKEYSSIAERKLKKKMIVNRVPFRNDFI